MAVFKFFKDVKGLINSHLNRKVVNLSDLSPENNENEVGVALPVLSEKQLLEIQIRFGWKNLLLKKFEKEGTDEAYTLEKGNLKNIGDFVDHCLPQLNLDYSVMIAKSDFPKLMIKLMLNSDLDLLHNFIRYQLLHASEDSIEKLKSFITLSEDPNYGKNFTLSTGSEMYYEKSMLELKFTLQFTEEKLEKLKAIINEEKTKIEERTKSQISFRK